MVCNVYLFFSSYFNKIIELYSLILHFLHVCDLHMVIKIIVIENEVCKCLVCQKMFYLPNENDTGKIDIRGYKLYEE